MHACNKCAHVCINMVSPMRHELLDVKQKLNRPWEKGRGKIQNHVRNCGQLYAWKTKSLEGKEMNGSDKKRKAKMVS